MQVQIQREEDKHVYVFEEYPLTKEGFKMLKKEAGVYMFATEQDNPLYIGTSWRLNVRCSTSHNKLKLAKDLGATKLCCLYVFEEDWKFNIHDHFAARRFRKDLEQELIQFYKPPLNCIKGQDTGYKTVELLLPNSLFVSIAAQAEEQGCSVNDLILKKLCN